MKILIACSGTGSRMGDYTKYTNKALLKIGNKFTIDYIISHFKNINCEFVITLGYYGEHIKQYLEIAYPEYNFKFVKVDNYDKKGSSQCYSILKARDYLQEPFIFIACDTIILDDEYSKDFKITNNKIYIYESKDSSIYTSVKCENVKILDIFEKGEKSFDYIYLGKTQIYDYKIFWESLEEIYLNDKFNSSIGDVQAYKKMLNLGNKFYYKIIKKWYDAGNLNIFEKEINKNLEYNVLTKLDESITFLDNKVIKFFHSVTKNKKRVERYKFLEKISPRILDSSDNFYSMEKIDSKPISELYIDNLIYKLLIWANEKLWIRYKTPENFRNTLYKFYYEKTIDRINKCKEKKILDFTKINDNNIGSIDDLISKVNFNDLCDGDAYNFHGDFILDNILIDNSNNFILIDWREDFGGDIKNGDIYYDLAKLKHNIFINHNNLQKNLYNLEQVDENSCIVDIKCNFFLTSQLSQYEKFILENNFNSKKINILMSLIWINMAPLHEYPLNNFLFNFGKFNLQKFIS